MLRRDWLMSLSTLPFSSAKKEMALTFETVDDADAGRLFFNELKLETSTLAYASQVYQYLCGGETVGSGARRHNVATKCTLQMDAISPKRDYDRLSTPSFLPGCAERGAIDTGHFDHRGPDCSAVLV